MVASEQAPNLHCLATHPGAQGCAARLSREGTLLAILNGINSLQRWLPQRVLQSPVLQVQEAPE